MLNMSNTNHVNVTEDIWTKLYLKFKNLTDPPDQIPHKNSLHFLLKSSSVQQNYYKTISSSTLLPRQCVL